VKVRASDADLLSRDDSHEDVVKVRETAGYAPDGMVTQLDGHYVASPAVGGDHDTWDGLVLRFRYAYVGLPALDAEQFVSGEHLLGMALSTLMRVPAGRQKREKRLELGWGSVP
jgi:hypothetical protein